MKFARISLSSFALTFALVMPASVLATPIIVSVTGQVNYSTDNNNTFGFGIGSDTILGATVSATWSFDTDNAGVDTYSSDLEKAQFNPGTDWIQSTLNLDTSTVSGSFDSADLISNEDTYRDILLIQDEDDSGDGFDRYLVRNFELDSSTGEHAFSYAQIYSYLDNLISSFDTAQTISWSAGDYANDLGNGYFEYYNGSTVDLGQYTIETFTVSTGTVPEPEVLILLALGLLGLGANRKSN